MLSLQSFHVVCSPPTIGRTDVFLAKKLNDEIAARTINPDGG